MHIDDLNHLLEQAQKLEDDLRQCRFDAEDICYSLEIGLRQLNAEREAEERAQALAEGETAPQVD